VTGVGLLFWLVRHPDCWQERLPPCVAIVLRLKLFDRHNAALQIPNLIRHRFMRHRPHRNPECEKGGCVHRACVVLGIRRLVVGIGQVTLNAASCAQFRYAKYPPLKRGSSVEIETELPGVEEKDVEIVLSDDVLTIKGEKRMDSSLQHSDYCHQERTFGKFARSITLPFEPDSKSVKTLFSRGVLKITLPKSAAIKQNTVKIPVKSAGMH